METIIKCFLAVNEQPAEQKTYANIAGTLLVDDNDLGNFFGIRIPCSIIPIILTISLGSGGTGYTAGDILTIVQAGGSLGTVIVDTVNGSGVIQTITLLSAGSGYSVANGLAVTGGTGNSATINILAITSITRNVVGACLNTSQGIRMIVTIDGEDVSDSLVGSITIAHNLNYISTFSLSLGDPKYSPLIDSHIAVNSVVIITAYINGQTIKMFTGLLDETRTTYNGGYRLQINGRDYGKKLLDKTMTLISVQDSASNSTRGSIVKYLAGQAGITNVNVPAGDAVTIDHSFQDQSLWDMIQKECAIEGWYVRFDENGIMKVKTRTIKTNETSYPTPDWEYGEDKFVQLGLETSDRGIINKVIILGAIFEEETITVNPVEPVEVVPDEPEYTEDSIPVSKSFVLGESVPAWSYNSGGYKVTASYDGPIKPSGYIFPKYQSYRFYITGANIVDVTYSISGGAILQGGNNTGCLIYRDIQSTLEWIFTEKAFSITITIKTKEKVAGGIEGLEEENPEETFTSTITYTQVKASVEDAASIALYGERKPNNEGTLEFPLAETETQCKRIGENIILDSHRFIKQPDDEVPFNPKLIVGETVEFTDKKIGYDEDRYFGEEVIHTIDIDKEGKIKARTRTGCVYYA
jgi:hypothetical protein